MPRLTHDNQNQHKVGYYYEEDNKKNFFNYLTRWWQYHIVETLFFSFGMEILRTEFRSD